MSENATESAYKLREYAAEEIRALLGRRKMSATQLGRQMGVSQAYIWRRLSGETAFDLDDLQKIAAILDVEVTSFLPRPAEGRVITAGGSRDAKDTHYYLPTPNGQAKRTTPTTRNSRPANRDDQPSVPPALRRPKRKTSTNRPATA